MGMRIIIKGADFSKNVLELGIEWHGWLGNERLNGNKIGHQVAYNIANNKVVFWSKSQRTSQGVISNGTQRRSFGIVDISAFQGATVKMQYTKNKSSSEYYAGFASDIDKAILEAGLITSAETDTMATEIPSGITSVGQWWNNTSESSVNLFELCDTVEKVIPTGAKYLLFDYIVQNDNDKFEGFVRV